MKTINLWEAMTAAETNHRREPETARGPEVTETDLQELSRSARFSGQELSLQATEQGWVLKVFSCDSDRVQDEIEILIPKDGIIPVKIVRDRYSRLLHIHE